MLIHDVNKKPDSFDLSFEFTEMLIIQIGLFDFNKWLNEAVLSFSFPKLSIPADFPNDVDLITRKPLQIFPRISQ